MCAGTVRRSTVVISFDFATKGSSSGGVPAGCAVSARGVTRGGELAGCAVSARTARGGGLAGCAIGAVTNCIGARDGALTGGAVSWGLRTCPFVGSVGSDEGSAAGVVLAGRHLRHADVAIASVGRRGDVVAGCGLACSLGGRRSGGVRDDTRRTTPICERSRARRYSCVCF